MQPLLTGEPSRVGDYRLLARLGKGSMGAVYLGHSRGGRAVAVKVVRPDLAEDPQFRERFRREARMSAKVGGFWTAAVVDADPDAEQPWLATEYVPGPTLHQAVAEHGPLPERTVAGLAAGLAEALEAVHGAELVHRDLKPANVLLGPDGPRVIDFGISRAMTASAMTATGMFFGTPGYFSPEQTLGGDVGPPSDVFSLGAVLVFAATGTGPFGNEHTAAMLYRVVHTEPGLSGVPEALGPLIAACLAKEAAARPTPAAVLDRLGGAGSQDGQWLPPGIATLVTEHTAQLRQAVQIDSARPQPDPVRPAGSGTRVHTSVPADPEQPPSAPRPPESREPIARARPRETAQQPSSPGVAPRGRPVVRKYNAGPVFRTGGRATALLSAAFVLLLAYGGASLGQSAGMAGGARSVFLLGITCLVLSGALSLLRAALPGLRLMINSDGLRVSRMGLRQEIPWEHVSRVGVVGRGKRQAVALWVRDGTPPLKSTWWHRVQRYHGGRRVFPVGAAGGWWTRRQEVKRLRAALHQYAPRAYDAGLL